MLDDNFSFKLALERKIKGLTFIENGYQIIQPGDIGKNSLEHI